jgi:hypothetical protein
VAHIKQKVTRLSGSTTGQASGQFIAGNIGILRRARVHRRDRFQQPPVLFKPDVAVRPTGPT